MRIADIRREYNLAGLRRRDLDADPIKQFQAWFDAAAGARASGQLRKAMVKSYKALVLGDAGGAIEVNAMTLSTVDEEGRPSSRIVLLKGADERGFIFYTNFNSRKGRELGVNPNAALTFYWADQERQVCISGKVSKVSDKEAEDYFNSRPRGSRLGAWASNQSEVIKDRTALEASWKELEARYPGEHIPKPPHWGGYIVVPVRVEFWQGRPSRLHDRFRYTRLSDGKWQIDRLSP
jgi:pyridoxamine 5'-phosphate oxidase